MIWSCTNKELIIEPTKDHMKDISVSTLRDDYYDDYEDGEPYTLAEFLELNHDEYGDEFITTHIDSIVDNIASADLDSLNAIITNDYRVKVRFRWNSCNPLGFCLLFGNPTPPTLPIQIANDLTECVVGVVGDKIYIIPLATKNGMLSDGYIFVENVSIPQAVCDDLNISFGTKIKAGIYSAHTPSGTYAYGFHVLDLF